MNNQRLKGRIALVAGGSKGLGRAIVLRLAAEGADVLVCGRDPHALQSVKVEVERLGGRAYAFAVDATKPEDVKKFFAAIKDQIGHLDIVVNSIGGVKQFGMFLELTDEDWYEVFEGNVMTTVRITREALPLLMQSKHARIINIASVAGRQAGWFNGHYGSMKAAVIHLTKYLANNYGRAGVRVNAVCPSTIKGGVWERDVRNKARMDDISVDEAETRLEADVKAKSVLGEIGTAEDVAAVVAFLASGDSGFVTGSCINVDGGTVKAI